MTHPAPRALAASFAALGTLAASLGAQQLPPVRSAVATVRAAEPLGSLQSVRQLPGGRVLVNDMAKRRVLLFDSTLATFTVVADSTPATATAYSGRIGGLIPYRGDSTLFVDPQSLSMLLIDPAGRVGRVMSVPRPSEAYALTGLAFGVPGFDARGRLVYRGSPAMNVRFVNGVVTMPPTADSMPIQRVDLATRRVDTAAFVKVYQPKVTMTQDAEGRPRPSITMNPLPQVDDWAVLGDGTIAVVRGRDFHVELIDADGRVTAAPKVPHEWQRMSDDDKTAFLDSTRTAMEKMRAERQAAMSAPGAMDRAIATMPNGGGTAVTIMMGGPGGPGGPGGLGGPPPRGGAPITTMQIPPVNLVPASELPDYKPAFAAGGARADADGRLWVRTIATRPMAGPVYDVLDRQGRLVDRVMIPAGTAIAGFGAGGVVYLGLRDAAGVHLQRAVVK